MNDCLNRFRQSIEAAGLTPPDTIQDDGAIHRFSTNGRRSDDSGWYVFHTDSIPAGAFGCWRAGFSQSWCSKPENAMTAAERAGHRQRVKAMQVQRESVQRQEWANNAQRNAALWAKTVPVADGDPVTLYLQRRGLAGRVPECLRLHPGLTYWDNGDRGAWPAMVAPLIRSDGRVLALHRTYLTVDGAKAPVPTVKKLTGAAGRLAGACIPLHEPQQGGVTGIAEGIETAQAAHLASGLPTVAAYCAGNLAAYLWPRHVNRIVVFADGDPAGAAAAQSLKARAMRAGLSVAVMTPTMPGADWCDVWAQRGVAPSGGAA